MEEIIALIDKIIDEHKIKVIKMKAVEEAVNDLEVAQKLHASIDEFIPGRHDQRRSLENLQRLLETTDEWLERHFALEEGALLTAFQKYASERMASELKSHFIDHKDLRTRIAHSREDVAELIAGRLSRHFWEASAYDVRAYITHTRKLIVSHAHKEEKLLKKVREGLTRAHPIEKHLESVVEPHSKV